MQSPVARACESTLMRSVFQCLLGLALWLPLLSHLDAATLNRTALVIGNGAYTGTLSRLDNPVRDAEAIATELKRLGFEVVLKTNLTQSDLKGAVREFGRRLQQRQGLGFYYFAGHGMQGENGQNYMIPIGAEIEAAHHIEDEGIALDSVLRELHASGNPQNIVMLDACRNNPVGSGWARSGSRGLAAINSTPRGTLIMYSTGAGQMAEDASARDPRHSPFARALLDTLGRPDLHARDLTNEVAGKVLADTADKQDPWISSSYFPTVYLASGSIEQYSPPVTPAAPTPSVSTPSVSTPSGLTKLEIKSEPAGATLFLDGNYVGGLPQSLTLPAGQVVTLEARLSGYETVRQPTTIPNTGSKQVTLMLDRIENPSYSAPASSSYSGASDAGSATNSLGMEFVMIPAGSFQMGSNTGDSDEKPVHTVQIRKSFRMMTTEVTQGQWQAVMGNNPSYFKNCGSNCPVENVSWNDIQSFIQKLNSLTGETYRLPSEAEWEYACRGGRSGEEYCGGKVLDQLGWYNGNSGQRTHPVGQKQANDYGLYDMTGNVFEWVEDVYHDSYSGHPGTESAWTSGGGEYRVLRGGAWSYFPADLRSAGRLNYNPSSRSFGRSFRLVADH